MDQPLEQELAALRRRVAELEDREKRRRQAARTWTPVEKRYQNLTHLVPVGIFQANAKSRCVYVNQRWCEITGLSPEEALGDGWRRSIHPADREFFFTQWQEAGRARTPLRYEYRLKRPDGAATWVLGPGMAERDAAVEIIGYLGTLTDVTEHHRATDALEQANRQRRRLEAQVLQAQKLESLGVLAGGVAHDFNNYLSAILGNVALLLLKLPADSALLPMLHTIERTGHHAAEVANQLLTFTGKGESETRLLDLDELVEEMAHLLKISVPRGIRLRRPPAGDLPPIQGDPNQIRQVVMNLILNAADAIGDAAGEITLSTSAGSIDRDYLGKTYLGEDLPEGPYVVLEVSDTGCGMDETTRDRLFDPFFTTKPDGRGLGMASVLGTVRGHRGAIKVDSEPGRGSTLRVHFAAAEGSEAAARVAIPPESLSAATDQQGAGTVLVVDDDPTIRALAREILEELGFTVLDAEDGLHAVEVFRQQADRVTAVLLDMTMPRLDGTGTFQELRRIRPGVRILLSTGFSEQQGAVERLTREGRAGLIRKPYHPIALVEKLAELLRCN